MGVASHPPLLLPPFPHHPLHPHLRHPMHDLPPTTILSHMQEMGRRATPDELSQSFGEPTPGVHLFGCQSSVMISSWTREFLEPLGEPTPEGGSYPAGPKIAFSHLFCEKSVKTCHLFRHEARKKIGFQGGPGTPPGKIAAHVIPWVGQIQPGRRAGLSGNIAPGLD